MRLLVVLVAAAALICGGFYEWARTRASATGASQPNVAGRISLLTEAVAYVGAILVLAGGWAALARRWHDISDWGHVGAFAAGAALFLLIGLTVRGVPEPALQRLVGVVWLLSVAGVGAAVGFAAHDVYGTSDEVTILLIGVSASVYAAALWLIRRRALQCAALFVALIVAICGALDTFAHASANAVAYGLTLWAFGLLWALLGWRRYLEPMWVAVPLGILLALVAPSVAVTDHGWVYAIGVLTAAAVMAVSVRLHNTVLLVVGTVGLFGYVTALVVRYFARSMGTPTALAVAGALILVMAALSARLMAAAKKPKPLPPVAEKPPSDHDLPKVR